MTSKDKAKKHDGICVLMHGSVGILKNDEILIFPHKDCQNFMCNQVDSGCG